jgi:putative heme-binding domain-containing protein
VALRDDKQSAESLVHLLRHANPAVKRAAAEALARCGDEQCAEAIADALAKEPDRFLEHALMYSLFHVAREGQLLQWLDDPRPAVQKAAMLILDQPPRQTLSSAQVLGRLGARDEALRAAALLVLRGHPEWAKDAVAFDVALGASRYSDNEQHRFVGSIVALSSRPQIVQWIGDALERATQASDDAGGKRRLLLLETMQCSGRPKDDDQWTKALRRALATPESHQQAVNVAATLQLPPLDGDLTQISGNSSEPTALRVTALRGIVSRHPNLSDASFDLLSSQLVPGAAPVSRLAAAEIVSRCRLTAAQAIRVLSIIRDDALISPQLMWPILQQSANASSADALLAYIEAAQKRGWRPDEKQLVELLRPLQSSHGPAVESLIAAARRQSVDKQTRLIELQPLVAGGDAARGRELFFGTQVPCSTCHRIGDTGGRVGPDLTKIGAIRSGNDLLESIVFPSSTIAQGFESHMILTTSGETLSGILVEKSADVVVLRDSSGADRSLRSDDIKTLRRELTSLMPEGLDRAMTPQQFRDLLSFLQGLR